MHLVELNGPIRTRGARTDEVGERSLCFGPIVLR